MSKWREASTKLWFLLLMIICDEGQKKSKDLQLCLYNAFAVSKEKNHFIFIRQSSTTSIFIVLARLWHQSWHLRNLMILTSTNLLNFCPKSHVHFLIPSPVLHILCPTWYKKWHFLGSKFCPVCEFCSFTLTLLWRNLPFLLNCGVFGLTTLKYTYEHRFLS